MQVRRLQGSEKFDAYLISSYCFHSRIDDVEKDREWVEKEELEDWGAFTEDGILAARIINNHYKFYVDAVPVKAGGIGAVSTLPEFREEGAVREIFRELLPACYQRGEVISLLYPFNHAFYRKQGYEVVTYQNNYELSPYVLSRYRFDGRVTRWNPGESVEEYLRIYNSFAKNFNLAMPRDEKSMLEHMKVEKLYQERKFSYLFSKDGENIAYLIFTDIRHDPAAILHVEECAWTSREGFEAILGFLGRFTADYGNIQLLLPGGIDLLRVIESPRSYEIHKTTRQDLMVRVINAGKLLEVIRKPVDCDFTVEVKDELIPDNNGVWRVTADRVEECSGKAAKEPVEQYDGKASADLVVSPGALGQLAVGSISLDEAMLRRDVEVLGKEEMLRRVFVEKRIYLGEHF